MRGVHTEMIEQFDHVLDETLECERLRPVRIGFPVPAQVQSHDAMLAGEVRHPCPVPTGAPHGGMQKQQRRRRAPWIGIVVDHVAQAQAVRGDENVHSDHRSLRSLSVDSGSSSMRKALIVEPSATK